MGYTFSIGPEFIYWCDTDNVPILGDKCAICGKPVRRVEISPPGDIRFASPKAIEILKELSTAQFGAESAKIFDGKIILLNKIAGYDRTDEVYVDGRLLAVLWFDPEMLKHKLDLKLDGARMLRAIGSKVAICDPNKLPPHAKGKGIKRPAVKEFPEGVKTGDNIIVIVGNSIGSGLAKIDSKQFASASPETEILRIRDLGYGIIPPSEKKATYDDVIKANLPHMKNLESRAVAELRQNAQRYNLPVTISFSGGKDSLAALGILKEAIGRFEAIYVNTGLEFPDTVQFVRDFCAKRNVPLKIAEAGDAFWQNVNSFGPPAKDFRWCCKVCKLAPMTDTIQRFYPRGTFTVDGKRRYESFLRSKIDAVERNPFVPGQVSIFPIRDWRSIEVWIYIRWKGFEYNRLYDEDFERIGCWLCPSVLESEFNHLAKVHPDLYARWTKYLHEWAQKQGRPREFVEHGFWRWKALPPKMIEIAKKMNLDLRAKAHHAPTSLKLVKGLAPCTPGRFSVESILTVDSERPFDAIAAVAPMLGKANYAEDLGVIRISRNDGINISIFASGHIVVNGADKQKVGRVFRETVNAVARAYLCTGCGICVKACPRHAVTVKRGAEIPMKIDPAHCIQCGKCSQGCVIVRYADKLTKEIE
ncbi:MAG: phosphoadenosine phosphosulfate reductase family protein [Candidatus Thermoplasmatota archaeon]|nr:phosphoadenosine phosphosulfate reductase family protein [Candidatus Thermoplasmatota archaeon]